MSSNSIKQEESNQKFGLQPAYETFVNDDVVFCFNYLTSKKNYNFDKTPDEPNKKVIYGELMKVIHVISKEKIKGCAKRSKKQIGGYELIYYEQIKHDIFESSPFKKDISKDTKLWVFRFGTDYRAVFHKSKESKFAILHLVGLDLDYTLYDHGEH